MSNPGCWYAGPVRCKYAGAVGTGELNACVAARMGAAIEPTPLKKLDAGDGAGAPPNE